MHNEVMKSVQCAHFPHRHNGFVASCELWTASGGVVYNFLDFFTFSSGIFMKIE